MTQPRLVLGTAGHIDHGKTALIRALTGVDLDRLPQEKQRGITIELGFTQLRLPGGRTLGVVDVPGHERFVKTMVAGASGIDLVLLVIAADEGIMPQTREHLDICRLLGVRRGLVALTKVDLVDPEWVEMVREEVAEFLRGSPLEGAPIVPCSSVTGEGLPELLRALEEVAGQVEGRSAEGFLRLPVDRSFSVRGFGTVVTGTLWSGSVAVGDEVELLPRGLRGRVRSVQVHGQAVERSEAGARTALNLQGVDRQEVRRGDVVVHPDTLRPTQLLDVELEWLASAHPLRNGAVLRLHLGTSLCMARTLLLEGDRLRPGETGAARLRLSEPVVAMRGDRFVLRGGGQLQTLGGGRVLDPLPPPRRRARAAQRVRLLREGDPREVAALFLQEAGLRGMERQDLAMRSALSPRGMEELLADRLAVAVGRRRLVHLRSLGELEERLLEFLREYHRSFPQRPGASREELRGGLGEVEEEVFDAALQRLVERQAVSVDGRLVRLRSHRVQLSPSQQRLKEELEAAFLRGGAHPPSLRGLLERFPDRRMAQDLVELLVREGTLVRVKEDLYFHARVIEQVRDRLIQELQERGEVLPSRFREIASTSRKYAIPLLEYFDRQRITLRVGDKRVLRRG